MSEWKQGSFKNQYQNQEYKDTIDKIIPKFQIQNEKKNINIKKYFSSLNKFPYDGSINQRPIMSWELTDYRDANKKVAFVSIIKSAITKSEYYTKYDSIFNLDPNNITNKIAVVKLLGSNDGLQCEICKLKYKHDEGIFEPSCKHVICIVCLWHLQNAKDSINWTKEFRCPSCNENIQIPTISNDEYGKIIDALCSHRKSEFLDAVSTSEENERKENENEDHYYDLELD